MKKWPRQERRASSSPASKALAPPSSKVISQSPEPAAAPSTASGGLAVARSIAARCSRKRSGATA